MRFIQRRHVRASIRVFLRLSADHHFMSQLIISLFRLAVYNDALYKAQQLERWYCVYRETAIHSIRIGSPVLCYTLHIQGISFCLYNRCAC